MGCKFKVLNVASKSSNQTMAGKYFTAKHIKMFASAFSPFLVSPNVFCDILHVIYRDANKH